MVNTTIMQTRIQTASTKCLEFFSGNFEAIIKEANMSVDKYYLKCV